MLLPDSKTELVRRGNKVVYDLGDKIVKVPCTPAANNRAKN